MQTSVASAPDLGVPGDIADLHSAIESIVDPVTSEEASAETRFGLMVKRGTADGLAKLLAATTDEMLGIAIRAHEFARETELGDNGLLPGAVFGCGKKGRFVVRPETAVTKLSGVYVRMVAGDDPTTEFAGALRGTVDGNALVNADDTFTAGADDVCTAVAHGLLTGDGPFRLTTSAADLPLNLLTATDYWIIRIDADTFYLATSRANAIAGTRVDIADAGTGTHTISDTADTQRVTTKNISKLARWIRSADAGEPAVLEIDMTNVALVTL